MLQLTVGGRHKKSQKKIMLNMKSFQLFVEINMLFQHVKQLEAMDMYTSQLEQT